MPQQVTQTILIGGKWKLINAAVNDMYTFPEYIIFNDNNTYSIAGKEGERHPILDGGWYNYDSNKHELRINTSNDAKKTFNIKKTNGHMELWENNKEVASYKKE